LRTGSRSVQIEVPTSDADSEGLRQLARAAAVMGGANRRYEDRGPFGKALTSRRCIFRRADLSHRLSPPSLPTFSIHRRVKATFVFFEDPAARIAIQDPFRLHGIPSSFSV